MNPFLGHIYIFIFTDFSNRKKKKTVPYTYTQNVQSKRTSGEEIKVWVSQFMTSG